MRKVAVNLPVFCLRWKTCLDHKRIFYRDSVKRWRYGGWSDASSSRPSGTCYTPPDTNHYIPFSRHRTHKSVGRNSNLQEQIEITGKQNINVHNVHE